MDALLTISYHLQMSLDAGMESYIVQLDFRAAFDRVSHSCLLFKNEKGSLLVQLGVCCPFEGSSSPTAGSELRLMMLLVTGFQSFLACHKEVCWVLSCSSIIPVKCLCWRRTDYMPML